MTPKEKATELKDAYQYVFFDKENPDNNSWNFGKQIVIAAIDEKIKQSQAVAQTLYWTNVKSEVEKT